MAPELLVALEEARRIVEPAAAALAAERATPGERAAIRAAYEAMVTTHADPAAATEADKAFHIAILDATHNPVLGSFRTAGGDPRRSLRRRDPGAAPNLPNHESVLLAIDRGDAASARVAMDRLLDVTRGYLAGLPLGTEGAKA